MAENSPMERRAIAVSRLTGMLSRTSTRIALTVVLLVAATGLFLWDSDIMLALQLKMNYHDRPTYATRLSKLKPLKSHVVGDRLVADSASIDVQLYGGKNSAGPLEKGAWIDPAGATPGSGQPIVVAGHRTTHHFATLHLLKRGQLVIVYWKGHEYDYVVKSVHAINGKSGISIQKDAPGSGERLVMYTCLPRWQGDKRNVVVAVPYRK
jgi:LPXTG-site transpeptidase (sortase) family protein